MQIYNDYIRMIEDQGVDLLGSQPLQDGAGSVQPAA